MRTLRASFLPCLMLAAAVLPPAAAADPAGGAEVYNFLFFDANARPVGLGGAYTALASDANALLYNPAGLGALQANEATFMHNQYLESALKQEYFSGVLRRGFGFSVNYFGFGDVNKATYAIPDGAGLGSYGLTDMAFSLGYGRPIPLAPGLSAGAAYKFLHERIDDASANGHALDLGLMYAPPRAAGLRLGAALQNIGPSVRFMGSTEELPLNFRCGAAYTAEYQGLQGTLSLDGTKSRSDQLRAAVGGEIVFARAYSIRVGYSGRTDAGPGITAGIGYKYRQISADYAFVPYSALGNAHRASVSWRWGEGAPAPRETPRPAAAAAPSPDAGAPAAPRAAAPPPAAGDAQAQASEPGTPAPAPAAEAAPPLGVEERFERAERFIAQRTFSLAKIELYEAASLLGEFDKLRILYHERLGYVSYLERDFEAARESYARAIALGGKLGYAGRSVADANAGMGLSIVEQRKTAEALPYLREALRLKCSDHLRALVLDELRLIED